MTGIMTSGTHNNSEKPILEVEGLHVAFDVPLGTLRAVTDVSFSLRRGETLAIVGESGSGKTMTSLAIMDILPENATRSASTLRLEGEDLLGLSRRELNAIRGDRMAMVFQDPLTALNPVYTIGNQMEEMYLFHGKGTRSQARERAKYILHRVGVSAPDDRLRQYPHQLSGGLRQRIIIGMALMCEPALIIADEPTTALDVTIQARILALLADLQREFNTALMLITHDMGVVARMADRVAVMYAGRVVEQGTTVDIFAQPRHPYTRALLDCIPSTERSGPLGSIRGIVPSLIGENSGCMFRDRCDFALAECARDPIELRSDRIGHSFRCIRPIPENAEKAISIRGANVDGAVVPNSDENILLDAKKVGRTFTFRRGFFGAKRHLNAVEDVDLILRRGEVLAIVGESGSGKTTLARMLLGLMPTSAGSISLNGEVLSTINRRDLARRIQPVFQDPHSSLNPTKTLAQIIAAPLRVRREGSKAERLLRVFEMMELVGLSSSLIHSYPGQLSGGQRQRVAIARALITHPDVVICDEPTSALDVSVQAQILNLLSDLRQKLGITYILISHDLSVVQHMADRAAVMYLGRIVEAGSIAEVFHNPKHPYVRLLLDSALSTDPASKLSAPISDGDLPDPFNRPSGCYFQTRCPLAQDICRQAAPPRIYDGRRYVECHMPHEAGAPAGRLSE